MLQTPTHSLSLGEDERRAYGKVWPSFPKLPGPAKVDFYTPCERPPAGGHLLLFFLALVLVLVPVSCSCFLFIDVLAFFLLLQKTLMTSEISKREKKDLSLSPKKSQRFLKKNEKGRTARGVW
jgi:hypothetical protein